MMLARSFLVISSILWTTIVIAGDCDIKTAPKYEVTEKGDYFIGEDKPGHPYPPRKNIDVVVYFNADEREAFRVSIVGGQILDAPSCQPFVYPGNKLDYVMDAKGNFYFFYNQIRKNIRHTSILAGKPVAGAGEIWFDDDGAIKKINSHSGHYAPAEPYFKQVLNEMKLGGVDFNTVEAGLE